ncbi:hypothetical protein BJ980_003390 [Nocardioides daedukensis]|uniref:LysM domain-containing protein n=1 Tax=Nocardioides daedukensis TaxID=634462 RepID=A0A7Y9S4L6_9ACTN|nr:LysM peptidoglycan-binding domain-containing protein [Nocardioides daedukensis]NYG60467.1 hypothetical protein [Nocardioides daedukensis]
MITRESPPAPLLRCLLVLTVVTTAAAAALRLLADDLARAAALDDQTLATGRFDEVLVPGAAVVLTACLAWFWLVTLVTCIEAGTALHIGFGPAGVRRVVLAACGLSLVAGLAPAHADTTVGQPPAPVPGDRTVLSGLPLPDRAASQDPAPVSGHDRPEPTRNPTGSPASHRARHTVQPGDSLWGLAESRLAPGADDSEITRAWRQIWAANRHLIGSDPDLIHPGTTLDLPASPKEK